MFKIYHYDTFDYEAILLETKPTKAQAIKWTEEYYGNRIDSCGADLVDIVDSNGNIVWQRKVK